MGYSVFDDGILCDCVSKQGRWDVMEEIELGHFICVWCSLELFVPFVEPGLYFREPVERVHDRMQIGIKRMNLTRMEKELGLDPAMMMVECRDAGILSEGGFKLDTATTGNYLPG